MRPYHHIGHAERRVIQKMYYGQYSLGTIGRRLGRCASTISREIQRNKTRAYEAQEATEQAYARRCRRKPKLDENMALRLIVVTCLLEWWSPEQISETVGGVACGDPLLSISHESIYRWVYRQRQYGRRFCDCLRQRRKKRQKRDGVYKKRVLIPGKKSIHTRPEAAAARTQPGHWEADLVHSTGGDSYLVTLVDRMIRYTTMAKIPSRDSETTVRGFAEAFGDIPNRCIRSITVDNGSEFSKFKLLEDLFDCEVYFADPYRAGQRGSNENTNGLIRQYLPKSTSFKSLTDEDVQSIKCALNNRPRKSLNFRTPEELFNDIALAVET